MARPIDIHAHLYCAEALEAYGEPYRAAGRYFGRSKAAHHHENPEEPISVEESALLFRALGIDKAVILNLEAKTRHGTGLDNLRALELCKPYEDVFLVFASVDPHRGETAAVELERAVNAGCVGLKLHPGYQDFFPDELEGAISVYRKAQDLGIPILFHQGTTRLQPSYIRPCRPVHLDKVAVDFPDLKIIISHVGYPWVDEAVQVSWRNPNVYMDLAGILPRYYPPQVWHYLQMRDLRDRVLFGSDYPMLRPDAWLEAWDEFDRYFCPLCNKEERLDEVFKEAVVSANAGRLLGDLTD
jgi:predicted TIM-barrel fold metal-dependent hydrolase